MSEGEGANVSCDDGSGVWLVSLRAKNGRGAEGSCRRYKEKAAMSSKTAANAIRSNWVGLRFLVIEIMKPWNHARRGPAYFSERKRLATNANTSFKPIRK